MTQRYNISVVTVYKELYRYSAFISENWSQDYRRLKVKREAIKDRMVVVCNILKQYYFPNEHDMTGNSRVVLCWKVNRSQSLLLWYIGCYWQRKRHAGQQKRVVGISVPHTAPSFICNHMLVPTYSDPPIKRDWKTSAELHQKWPPQVLITTLTASPEHFWKTWFLQLMCSNWPGDHSRRLQRFTVELPSSENRDFLSIFLVLMGMLPFIRSCGQR